jgi:hypothetical protein
MAYITKSNFNSIFKNLEYATKSENRFRPVVFDKAKIPFFAKFEEDKLKERQEFLQNPEKVLKIYQKKKPVDTLMYVFEGGVPAYHKYNNCEKVTSSFKNFTIPASIREKGEAEVKRFREWFKENGRYLEEKPDLFAAKLHIAFNVTMNTNSVEVNNSGVAQIDNLNLNQLEDRINEILTKAIKFYNDNPSLMKVIDRFKKYTFLAYKDEEIKDNKTNLSDLELKSFLKEYDLNFKKPMKELLLQYYMVKYNPDLNFDGLLLEQLGFKQCSTCHEVNYTPQEKNQAPEPLP